MYGFRVQSSHEKVTKYLQNEREIDFDMRSKSRSPLRQSFSLRALAMLLVAPNFEAAWQLHVAGIGSRSSNMQFALRNADRRHSVPAAAAKLQSSRSIAHSVLIRCFRDGAFADRALDAALANADIDRQDAALVTDLVYGCLSNVKSLDWSLSKLAKLKKTPLPALVALRMGAYQLLHSSTPDHAACNEAVSLIGEERTRKFVNGVLRNLSRKRAQLGTPTDDPSIDPLKALAITTSTPEWILRALHAGPLSSMDELASWANATQQRPNLTLRLHPNTDASDLVEWFSETGVHAAQIETLDRTLFLEAGSGHVSELPGFEEGYWTVQDLGAQLVGLLSAPPKGGRVLDLCSAPGGKTTHLAELMGDDGHVLSIEVNERKANLVKETCERLGLGSVDVHVADASDSSAMAAIIDPGQSTFDAVVLDAPCSGTGALRRNPDNRLRDEGKAQKQVKELTALQDKLLDAAAQYVRPGGSLTYSVCSCISAETEERVSAFLQRHAGDFEIVAPITDLALQPFVSDSSLLGERSCIRTWTHRHPADSHFAVKMLRRSD